MKRLFKKAVEDPIHFPPLSRAVFPGDKVVLVPDPFVLAHGRLLETLIDHLIDYGITPSDITVMMTEQERSLAEKNDHLQSLITKKEKKGVVFHSFLPYKPDSCSILCNRSDGEPIALARPLVDADVVIPVERHYQTPPFGHYGTLSALAPRFCDLQTQIHFTAGDRPEKEKRSSRSSPPKFGRPPGNSVSRW